MINSPALYPWLQKTWRTFLDLSYQQRLPQTFLISGAGGLGKATLIESMEQYLLCTGIKDKTACGKCQPCHLYQQKTHPDYRQLGTDDPIGIDEIREMGDFFNQTSHQAGRSIITLKQVDKLHPSAANALLKNLEEPSRDVIFLLVAEKSASVIATIRSRAFKMPISIPAKNIAISWLSEKHPSKSRYELEWGLTLSAGAPLKADNFLTKENAVNKDLAELCEILFFKKVELLYQKEMQQRISTEPQEVLNLLYYLMIKLVYHFSSHEKDTLPHLLTADRIQAISQRITLKNLLKYVEKIEVTLQEFTLNGVNKALLLESLIFSWVEM